MLESKGQAAIKGFRDVNNWEMSCGNSMNSYVSTTQTS
jgi:hypothetical protein